jgi:hypothetical protein
MLKIWLLVAAEMLAVTGCGNSAGSEGAPPIADYSKVRSMSAFYEAYLNDHRSQPPKDEAAFRSYLAPKQEQLQKAGLTLDEMFTSPRDGQPLKWVYGMSPPKWKQGGFICYGYEAEPTAGKRLVLGSRGMFSEIDESQFRSIVPKG